jgi:AraC-like DNA-binding protein
MNPTKYIEQLKGWFKKFKYYKVTYKNGYYNLSNLANSPYTIVESFDKMPFCKHDKNKKLLTSDTLFLKAELYYLELEEDLWIFVSDLQYKKNLLMTNIYDKTLPIDYHFLNLHFRKKAYSTKSMIVNGIVLTDRTWSVFKAGEAVSDYHFKESDELNITIYFSNDWLKKQLKSNKRFIESGLNHFFNSSNTYLLVEEKGTECDSFYDDLLSLLKANENNVNHATCHKLVKQCFEYFNDKLNNEGIQENSFSISDKDRKNIQQAEKQLMDNLLKSFPGIEALAKKIGISPTKLKSDFKTIHNQTLYQYYSHHQMQFANILIAKNQLAIKEVAKVLGYDNASKFSAAFKKHFDVEPSNVRKEN